ncbi:NACHT, LRR and PYD domains-containing protein 12-like isoform 2-T2 [Pholidichthys leucotaenia]
MNSPSLKSSKSKFEPLDFDNGPGSTDEGEKKMSPMDQQLPQRSLCQDVLRDQSGSPGAFRERTRVGLDQSSYTQMEDGLQETLNDHKISLRKRYEHVTEGTDKTGRESLLNRVYTELYITEGQCKEFLAQHEVRWLETISKMDSLHDTEIKRHDIFKELPNQWRPIRVVVSSGVAGVGKTFLIQKFTLDWANDLENKNIRAVFLLPFRELNLIRDEQYSLLELLHVFYPALQKVTAEELTACKLLFIFDGLDESKLSLDFTNKKLVSDITQKSSISELLTNLIEGYLLPSALIWITSRPAAANQIPLSCVDRVTEVRGFGDNQKEEYFSSRFSGEEQSSKIISHVKASKTLYIMCTIPVFCWITATILERMLTTEQRGELPKTLSNLYSCFLLIQTKTKKCKYHERHETSRQKLTEPDRELLLKLGRLAFEHLEKGNIVFYQEDLEQCGLDVKGASVYSGVCTEIFRRECVMFQKPVYCFVHLTIQEYLAAVYLLDCFTSKRDEVLQDFLGKDWVSEDTECFPDGLHYPLIDFFLKKATEKSLESKNGHLDLFVRFLHGLSLESNQRLLRGLLHQTDNNREHIQRTLQNLKKMNTDEVSPDRSINIFHCLTEMNDTSVHQDIQEFLKSENRSNELSEIHCSALAYMLEVSEEVLDEVDLKKYNTSKEGRLRLIPAVRKCRRAKLSGCRLSEMHCEVLQSALQSNPSHVTELDLSYNTHVKDLGVKRLCCGIETPHCILERLRLKDCQLTCEACSSLVSALKLNPSHLKELDLSKNFLQDSGLKLLTDYMHSTDSQLQILRVEECKLSESSCASLSSALKSETSHLIELDLSRNVLKDSGVEMLSSGLGSPSCVLEILRLEACSFSVDSFTPLVSAWNSNPSHLRKLDLSKNNLGDAGVKQLCGFLKNPNCRLDHLRIEDCNLTSESCSSLVPALKSNPSHLKHLDLSNNKLQDLGAEQLCGFLERPHCVLQTLRIIPRVRRDSPSGLFNRAFLNQSWQRRLHSSES